MRLVSPLRSYLKLGFINQFVHLSVADKDDILNDGMKSKYTLAKTRVTARTKTTIEDEDKRVLKLDVRSAIDPAKSSLRD